MAINLCFIDFIVPITKIREIYPGGWEKCIYDNRKSLGGPVYFDEHLFHTGAMDPADIEKLIERWSALGFEGTEVIDGKRVWKDFCVVESLLSYSAYACRWLIFKEYERYAYLAGTEPGTIVGRRVIYERRKTRVAKSKFKMDCRRMRWKAYLIYKLRCFRPLTEKLYLSLVHQQEWEPTISRV